MLTKDDLLQIKNLLKEEIDPLKNSMESQFKIIESKFKQVRSDIFKLRKDLDITIRSFDQEYLGLEKRVDRIENHLDISS